MKQTKVLIFDNYQKTSIEAYLVEDVPLEMIVKANAEWIRIRQQYRDRCRQQGLSYPEHSHWNWEDKAELSEMSGVFQTRFGILCQDEIQGLMLVEQKTEFAKLPPDGGKPLLYVVFLETAPHNIEIYVKPRRFCGVGGSLMNAAIDYSREQGYEGRIGLHALPQAEQTYHNWGMTRCGKDPSHSDLCYFEFTSQQADVYQTRPNLLKGENNAQTST
jgi:GNAT superfamily N-acetyltransferase